MDTQLLQDAGLSLREADVYLALLRLGPVPVSRLAKETGLHRTNIYDTLEKLREKGIVSSTEMKGVRSFAAAPPARLLEYLDERKDALIKLMPDLVRLTHMEREETYVAVFKGTEGIKTVWNDILAVRKDIVWAGTEVPWEELMPNYARRWVRLFNAHGLRERGILKREELGKITPSRKHEYRYLPKTLKVPTFFVAYGTKVALFVWTMPYFSIIIDNREIAATYRDYFEFMWRFAKRS